MRYTLQEINISHLGKRKIIFKSAIFGGYVSSLEGILLLLQLLICFVFTKHCICLIQLCHWKGSLDHTKGHKNTNRWSSQKLDILHQIFNQSIKHWMGPYQRTPKALRKLVGAIRYSGLGVHSVGPVRDFLESITTANYSASCWFPTFSFVPNLQDFRVVFDTGSAHIILPAAECKSEVRTFFFLGWETSICFIICMRVQRQTNYQKYPKCRYCK